MRIFIMFLFLLLIKPGLSAQTGSTKENNEPWIGNNAFLNTFLERISFDPDNQKCKTILINIPLKIWIYKGYPMSKDEAQKLADRTINQLNNFHENNNTGIRFYMDSPPTLQIKKQFYKVNYYTQAPKLSSSNKEKGMLNIHITDEINKSLIGKNYGNPRAVYNSLNEAIFIETTAKPATLTHEVGHYLGLRHTHEGYDGAKCKKEPVSRTLADCKKNGLMCETAGDFLSDTPADPMLSGKIEKNGQYSRIEYDDWGTQYVPLLDNIMSYHNPIDFRTKFTRMQIAVMLYTAQQRGYTITTK